MNYELRPPRRGLVPNLSPDPSGRIGRVEYLVFTKADPSLAWKIFSDIKLWPKFSDRYTSIAWKGTPWTPGSRLRIEVREPVITVVDRALTLCLPPQHIAWISHVAGYTMEQWIAIEPSAAGGSRVSTWIEVTGTDFTEGKKIDLEFLKGIIIEWFDNFTLECDRVAETRIGDFRPRAD
jgi:hypothetical protein